MSFFYGILGLALASCGAVRAQEAAPVAVVVPPVEVAAPVVRESPDFVELKPLYLETPLVEGSSAIPIVVPADGSHDADAAVIANAIEAAGGARPALLKDDDFAAGSIEQHVIALGNRSTNKLLSALYNLHYSLTDLRYPGPGGHEVRTLHNPLGNGKNVILIGGSDAAGVTNGALRFSQMVGDSQKTGSGLVIGRLMEIQLGAGMTPPMDLEQFATWDSAAGGDFGWNSLSKRMAMYYMTGDAFHANEFLRLAFPNDQAKAELEVLDGARIESRDAPLSGTRREFAHRMVLYWDLIEESPAFSDDDRLRVARALAMQAERAGLNGSATAPQFVGSTEEQWSALAQYCLGRYFAKDYANPEWPLLRDQGAKAFSSLQSHAWVKGEGDDLANYSTGIAPILSYLLLTGDRVPMEQGALATLLRGQEILASGRDGDWALARGPISFFHQAAQLTGDGRWLEYARRAGLDQENFRVGQSWWPALAAAAPVGLAEAWLIHGVPAPQVQARNSGLSKEETFQFMSYRSAPDATGDFILLDGFQERSRQALGVLELRQDGQTILEGGSSAVLTRGEGPADGVAPTDAALKHQRVMGEMAIAVAEAPNAGAAGWRRSIVHRRGRYTLLLDSLTPRADADNFEIQFFWSTGQGDWAVGPGASSILLPGAVDPEKTPALQISRAMGLSVAGKIATFTSSGPASKGQAQHLFTLIGRGPVGSIACVPLSDHAAALHLPTVAVVNTGAYEGLEGGIVLLEPDHLYGLDLTSARELLSTNAPIEIAWDLREGILDVVTSTLTNLTLALEGPDKLRLDRTPLTGELVDGKVRIALGVGRHRITGATLSQGRLDVNIKWLSDTVNKALAEAQPAPNTSQSAADTTYDLTESIRVARMERGLSSPRTADGE